MKKFVSLFLACLMFATILPVSAADEEVYRKTEVIHTENGDMEVETVLVIHDSPLRAKSRTASKTKSFKLDETVIATVTFTATFQYDGSSVSVSNTDSSYHTYDGWSYKNESISKSGGTAKLSAKLTHSAESPISVSISIKCTADGTIS